MSKGKKTPPACEYAVESDVPVPAVVRPRRPSKYPFASMLVGDSFEFDFKHYKRIVVAAQKSPSAQKDGWRFSVRRVSATRARMWRVA